jgi:hypothetical protein
MVEDGTVDYLAGLDGSDTSEEELVDERPDEELTEKERRDRAKKAWEKAWEAKKQAHIREILKDLAVMHRRWEEEEEEEKIRAIQLAEMRRRREEEARNKAKPGYRGRFLSLPPERYVRKIWETAEERLGIERELLGLVHESHYLPESGMLEKPVQIFEIRIKGRGGGKLKPARVQVREHDRFTIDIEDSIGNKEYPVLRTSEHTETSIRSMVQEDPWGWCRDLFIHFRRGTEDFRLGIDQELHGGTV